MKRRFAMGATLGALASLVGLAVVSPFGAVAQEEGERSDEDARRMRVVRPVQAALVAGARAGGYLGVRIADVDDEDVERLDLPEERGALVLEVVDDTPAAEAGLRVDDVIVGWNDESVESAAEFSRLVRETPEGRAVRLDVIRGGSRHELSAELGDRGDMFRNARLGAAPEMRFRGPMLDREGAPRAWVFRMGGPRLGVSVTAMGDQLGEYFGVEDGDGVLVTRVLPETPAARAGLRAGDVILSVAGEEVDGHGDIGRILRDREAGPVELRIVRDREERTLTAELEEPHADVEGSAFLGPELTPELAPLHLEVTPLPPVPPLEAPHVEHLEIEVDGLEDIVQEVDWEAFGDAWETWGEELAERAGAWRTEWEDAAGELEARWREWAESWDEAAERWSEEWEERAREWEESLEDARIEVTYRAGPVFL